MRAAHRPNPRPHPYLPSHPSHQPKQSPESNFNPPSLQNSSIMSYATDLGSPEESERVRSVRKGSRGSRGSRGKECESGYLECGSNRSCSREKMLESRIQGMLREQQEKLIQVAVKANRIKFSTRPHNINIEREVDKQPRTGKKNPFLSDLLQYPNENKENSHQNHQQKQQKFLPNETHKSNKLSLRQYLDCPSDNSGMKSHAERGEPHGLPQDKVLDQVRELKEIFIELMKDRNQVKTRRKTSQLVRDWSCSARSRDLFTLP